MSCCFGKPSDVCFNLTKCSFSTGSYFDESSTNFKKFLLFIEFCTLGDFEKENFALTKTAQYQAINEGCLSIFFFSPTEIALLDLLGFYVPLPLLNFSIFRGSLSDPRKINGCLPLDSVSTTLQIHELMTKNLKTFEYKKDGYKNFFILHEL